MPTATSIHLQFQGGHASIRATPCVGTRRHSRIAARLMYAQRAKRRPSTDRGNHEPNTCTPNLPLLVSSKDRLGSK